MANLWGLPSVVFVGSLSKSIGLARGARVWFFWTGAHLREVAKGWREAVGLKCLRMKP